VLEVRLRVMVPPSAVTMVLARMVVRLGDGPRTGNLRTSERGRADSDDGRHDREDCDLEGTALDPPDFLAELTLGVVPHLLASAPDPVARRSGSIRHFVDSAASPLDAASGW
jgi:hypothetical protein